MNYMQEKRQKGFIVVASIAVGVMAVSTYQSIEASKDQAAAQRESIKVQGRQNALEAQRERIKQVRAARIARASVLSGASASGMGAGTSGVQGATASIGSQLGSNIGDIGVSQSFAEQASAANIRAANAGAKLAQWQAIGGLSSSIFTAAGGFSAFKPPIQPAFRTPTSGQ